MKNYKASLFIILIVLFSCNKKSSPPPNNNEVNATVIVSPSTSVIIDAKGNKARMVRCVILGGGTYIEGSNGDNAAVLIHAYSSTSSCVTSPGNYYFYCEYRPNLNDINTPIFSSSSAFMTFAKISDEYMEGTFSAVCTCTSLGCAFGVDSVIVTGTFKGDFIE